MKGEDTKLSSGALTVGEGAMFRLAVLMMGLNLAFATPGHAQGQPPSDRQTIPFADAMEMLAVACAKDIDAHCAGVNIGGGRLKGCLIRNQAIVSANCRDTYGKVFTQFDKRGQARRAVIKPCEPDARKICAGAQMGDGEILQCVLQAKKGVGWRCSQAITDAGYR
jgi:hypothetical protein